MSQDTTHLSPPTPDPTLKGGVKALGTWTVGRVMPILGGRVAIDRLPDFLWYFLYRQYGVYPPKPVARMPYQHHEQVCLDKVQEIPGDIAECGVFYGASLISTAIKAKIQCPDRKIFGFDSFEGFPDPSEKDRLANGVMKGKARRGYVASDFDEVQRRLTYFGVNHRVTLIKGFFSETLSQVQDRCFALVFLDCDLYDSYKTCLDFFYPRLSSGGIILFDEYHENWPGATRAVDEFFADKPEKVQQLLDMPTLEGRHKKYYVQKRKEDSHV